MYQGTTTSSGSYTENKAKIELLEGQVKRLQEQLDSMSQTGDEKDKKIAELNDKVTNIENEKNELQNKANELVALKENLGKVTATENQILKSYTAYKDGKLITGTMANYAGKTVTASSITENGKNAEVTIPQAGYYGTDSKISIPLETIKKDKIYYKRISSSRTNLGTNTHKVDFSDCPGFENATISNFNIIAGGYYAQFDKNYNYNIKCKISIDNYDSKNGILTIRTEFLGSGYNGESIITDIGILLNIE